MALIDLIRKKSSPTGASPATAIHDIAHQAEGDSVSKIAVAGSDETYELPQPVSLEEINDELSDRQLPDEYCWPFGLSMNTSEVAKFQINRDSFMVKGLNESEAEILADKIVFRDREIDDRRYCLECAHLQGYTNWRCDNWKIAAIGIAPEGAYIPKEFAKLLQRCDGFRKIG